MEMLYSQEEVWELDRQYIRQESMKKSMEKGMLLALKALIGASGMTVEDAMGAVQAAAEATGEAPAAFVARAVQTQAERDKAFLKMGIDPATGNKLKREA